MVYEEKENPYSKGFWGNCSDMWCGPIQPSEVSKEHYNSYEKGKLQLEQIHPLESEIITVQSTLVEQESEDIEAGAKTMNIPLTLENNSTTTNQ